MSSIWKFSCQYIQRFNLIFCFHSLVLRMKMGWVMILKIHPDNNSIETRYFRHKVEVLYLFQQNND